MKFKFLLLSGIFMLLCYQFASSQATQSNYFLPTFYPRAPNTASIEKFGSYDVNLFTGVPNISIPLYTIDAGSLKIPITLSYHASGIRVSEVASWVGLGWGLSAGGVISRNIIGKADDGVGGYLQGLLRLSNSFSGTTNADVDSLNYYNINNYDARPDIYSYDFPGHGGKFFLDGTNSYKPTFVPYSPIKVSYKYTSGGNQGLTSFYINDEQGNKFTFGDAYLETTYTNTQSTPAVPSTSGWPLERAISQNRRDTVNFSYATQQVIQPDVTSQTDIVDDQLTNMGAMPYSYGYKQGQSNISSSSVTEQLLQHIYFKNGRVDFELETTARSDLSGSSTYALKDIAVYKYNYGLKAMELQKKVIFYKSYFNPSSSSGQRLKLDSIQVLDKAGSIIQHYRFDYNLATPLPNYLSMARDYWGFYNGKANTSLTPNMTIQVVQNGNTNNMTIGSTVPNSRFSDSTYMQAAVLTGIHYPTGGYSTFTYQTNQYMSGGVLQQAGGLRIASISNYDGVNPTPIVKTYQYDIALARANFILDNVFFSTIQNHQYWGYTGSSNQSAYYITATERERIYVSNPRIDLEPWDAATVVYPHVIEFTGTPTANTGKTDYTFRDLSDTENIGSMAGTPIINSYFYARGQLLTKNQYLRKTDGTYQMVQAVTNSYTAFPQTFYNNVGLVVGKNIVNDGGLTMVYPNSGVSNTITANGFLISNYNIISDDNYIRSTSTANYDLNTPANYTTSTVNYNYDNITHQQVTRTYHTDSKGNTIVKRNRYPADYLSGTTTGSIVLDSMLNRNMQATVIESIDSLRNAITSYNGVTGSQFNLYKNGYIANTIVPSTISTLSIGTPVNNFTQSSYSSNTLTKDSRYEQVISFDQYDPQNNLAQYTPRNANPTAVLWDQLYQLPVAQVKNATWSYPASSQLAYTSFESDNKNGWMFTGAPVKDVTALSGYYSYPLSAGSVSTNALDNTKAYVVSYWSNNGAATLSYGSSYITGSPLKTIGGWTYYEHQLPTSGSAGSVTISGTTSIDELRLFPATSLMTNYIYDPNGLIAMDDPKGTLNHFEYDYAQRLKNVKDIYGNIVTSSAYHLLDMTVASDAQSAVFTRNNCPSGTSPQSTNYSVPAAKYYSYTKASANAEAVYDLNTNGQVKANTVCGCPIQTISFTLTNSTGNPYTASFSGGSNPSYNFPNSGTTTVQIPAGTYSSVYIAPFGSFSQTFTMGSRTPIMGHSATFNTVVISSSSTDSSITIH